ncbi:NAD(P)-binding protein [Bacillus sp. 165]|uniref:NAD(P)-binding protein n=1 Tax=Bacillus sp. 165 TaxID=1529117 RepID=UPI001AD95B55|nr:NAD(P)-binding protein [Bacillus sp. 165]MBO9128338.1 NAD(P)-binding protein [Bacillus sp. 165]
MYPISVRIQGKRVVVAGGGRIASFKIALLLEEGANITVISPRAVEEIRKWAQEQTIQWIERNIEISDCEDAFLIIAATDDVELNDRLEQAAKSNQLVNVITNPEKGNVHFPAALKQGKLLIAVSTEGASPKLAKKIRNDLAALYDESYADYLEFLYECRIQIKRKVLEKGKKNKLLLEVLKEEYRLSEEKRRQFLKKIEVS